MVTYDIEEFVNIIDKTMDSHESVLLVHESIAELNVKSSYLNQWMFFKIENTNANNDRFLFKTNNKNWFIRNFASEFSVTNGLAISTHESKMALNPVKTFGLTLDMKDYLNRTVEYDRVRWMARDIFSGLGASEEDLSAGVFGLDLFSNENAIREEISDFDNTITNTILDAITNSDNKTSEEDHVAKYILYEAALNSPDRFSNSNISLINVNNMTDDGFYRFRFSVGDKIRIRVNYKVSKNMQISGLPNANDHSYLYVINVI